MTPLRCIRALVLSSCVLGCAATVEQKVESFVRYQSLCVDGWPVKDYLTERRVLLFAGAPSLEVHVQDDDLRFSCGQASERSDSSGKRLDEAARPLSVTEALAVPIEPPGYFLTAAHAVELRPVHLVWWGEGVAAQARADVVWVDERSDLALLHANLDGVAVFPWSEQPRRGDRIIAGALGSPSAGRVLDVSAAHTRDEGAAIDTYEIDHDAPVADGDSGAPIVDESGHLVAVHTSTGLDLLTLQEVRVAVRPNIDQLSALVTSRN